MYQKNKNNKIYYDNKKIQKILTKTEKITKIITKIKQEYILSIQEKTTYSLTAPEYIAYSIKEFKNQVMLAKTFNLLKELYGTKKPTELINITEKTENKIDLLIIELLNEWETKNVQNNLQKRI